MKKQLLVFLLLILTTPIANIYAQVTPITANSIWQRPQIIPVPSFVDGVKEFKIDISEGWLVKNDPVGRHCYRYGFDHRVGIDCQRS